MFNNSSVQSLLHRRRYLGRAARYIPLMAWLIFAAGLFLQSFSPGLRIQNHKVVMGVLAAGQEIHPAQLIARERIVQTLSAFLTLSGALGLAACYGPSLFKGEE